MMSPSPLELFLNQHRRIANYGCERKNVLCHDGSHANNHTFANQQRFSPDFSKCEVD